MRRRQFFALGLGVAASTAALAACGSGPGTASRLGPVSVVAAAAPWTPMAQAYGRALEQRGFPLAGRDTTGPITTITVTGLPALAAAELNHGRPILEVATPLARLAGEPVVVVVPGGSRYTHFDAFAAQLVADPARTFLAGGPTGETDHVLFGLIARGVGADSRLVDYSGYAASADSVPALLNGAAAAAAGTLDAWRPHIAQRRVRVLAVSTDERVPEVDAPTLKECGVRVDFAEWCAAFGPKDMADPARQAAMAACDEAAYSDQWLDACRSRGWTPMPLSGEDFRVWLTSEVDRTRDVLIDLGLLDTPATTYRG
ncbi:tripartite tricarboxylate transporter substrate-binding protein [Nonomuraea sp. NPDC050663]|uniref:tripartite tricarboxylate transporter substrate-binding protein n=1 Tax=Nonomuraea sp. NPDC050663 TaxID=3364370 RepID=UPI00378800D3